MKKHIILLFFFTVCLLIASEEREWWTFSYLDPTRLQSRPPDFITVYPEFRELLEQIKNMINKGEYDAVSRILRDEISSFHISTRHAYEFEKITALIHIDAALDYFLLDKKQQGLNKQYMAFYLLGRRKNILFKVFSEALSFTIINNSGINPDPLFRFALFVRRLPVFYHFPNWDLNNFNEFQQFLLRYYDFDQTYDFDFIEFYNSFTVDNFVDDFDLIEFLSNVMFTEEEREAEIASYFYEDDRTRWFYHPLWTLNEVFNLFSLDLLYMRDFSNDLRIVCNPVMLEIARMAVGIVDADIQIDEVPIKPIENRTGETHEMSIFITFRKARAEAFFNQYYRCR